MWARQNPEKTREYARRHYAANKEKRKAKSAAWVKDNYDKHRAWRHKYRLASYGLTPEVYAKMLVRQANACAICLREFVATPHIDHDHKTGKVRGLLCSACNTALGKMSDSIDDLKRAITYLRRKKRWT